VALLVLGEVAIEERDLALALEGEDVRRDAVERSAVVGHHCHTVCRLLEGVLLGTERVHIEVIRGLLKQQGVRFPKKQAVKRPGRGLKH
jgi:hypothetical protein